MDNVQVGKFHLWHLLFLPGYRLAILRYLILFRCIIYSAWQGNHYVGAGGVMLLWGGVGEGFLIITDELRRSRFSLCRIVKQKMDSIQKQLGLRRLQVVVCDTYQAGQRFVIALGFQCEAKLDKYGEDGKDYWIYSKIREVKKHAVPS